MKPTISKPFKSNDRTFDKVYNAFDKRDYFNSQGLAKTQIGNFERALQKNDKGAQQVLDLFKGDEKKAKDYITQVISDRNKERAFNNYKALKSAVDSIQKGKPNVGEGEEGKRRRNNAEQKYSIALYSTLRNKKFTKWKDVHNDIDSLIGESVNEGKAFVVMYKVKKDLPNRNVKPSSAAYSKEADAKKFLKSIEKDGPNRKHFLLSTSKVLLLYFPHKEVRIFLVYQHEPQLVLLLLPKWCISHTFLHKVFHSLFLI